MKSIVVFCGSGIGHKDIYRQTAVELGTYMAQQHITLVYGGAQIGIMGTVAQAVLDHGGHVIGVIPEFLCHKEVAHPNLSQMIITQTMHERKLKMHELSDGIITLPGGWGTMEELFEMLTWAQLGLHQHPIGLLNVDGYYNALILLCNDMATNGFLSADTLKILIVADNITELLAKMEAYKAPEVPAWLRKENT